LGSKWKEKIGWSFESPWPFGLGIRVWVTRGNKRVLRVLRASWPFGLGTRVWVTRGKKRVLRVLRAHVHMS
jgi:hypothetical protein